MSKGALFRGPPVLRFAVTVAAALGLATAALPVGAQDSRSLQDMLLAAVRLGDTVAVRSLLAAGADVAKRGANGKTAIDIAVEMGKFEIAEMLVQERRRQRDAALAAPVIPPAPAEVEIVQRTAEAAPEIVPQRVVSLPKAPLPAPPVTFVPTAPAQQPTTSGNVPAGATVEQLLAVAQQLTLAAQNLAAAQRSAPSPAASIVRAVPAVEMDFLPRPGRKPEIEQASISAPPLPRVNETSANVAPTTVVVTPRRRTVEESVEQARRDLETGQDLPVIPPSPAAQAPSAVVPSTAVRVAPQVRPPTPAAVPAESNEPDNGLIRAVKGIGGFLGIGPSDSGETKPAAQPTPTHAKPGSSREMMKRDRSNTPHVPARRASEFQSQSTPQGPAPQPVAQAQPSVPAQQTGLQPPVQAGMPPVRAIPVAPVQEQPIAVASADRTAQLPPPNMSAPSMQSARLSVRPSGGGLNPFDPENMPQGSVLPLSNPLSGNAPEIVRPRMLPDPADAVRASEEAALRETLRQAAAPQRTANPPQAAVPDVPPLRAPAASASPTAMFERRAAQSAPATAAKPVAKPNESALRSLANVAGLGAGDDELPADAPAGVSASDRLTSNRMPVLSLRNPLVDVPLTLGNSVATDQKPLPRGVAEPDPCLKRSGGTLLFCVVPVDWHPRVDPAFSLTTYLYQGSRAIARYDGGKATHYHTLFSSLAYDDVVKYFTTRYGPPTDEWKRSIAPFDQPRQPNPTLVWRSKDSRTNKVTILEVRRYDDTRNVFPDMEHGAVRLYAAGAQRVFPVISGMDLMGIDWAARSNHSDNPNDPALANTIRVGK